MQNADLERLGRWAVDSARRPENVRSGLRYVKTVDLTVVELISLVGFSLASQSATPTGCPAERRDSDKAEQGRNAVPTGFHRIPMWEPRSALNETPP